MADTSSPAFDRVGPRPDVIKPLGGSPGPDRFSNGPLPAPVHMMDRNGTVDDKPLDKPGPPAEENRFGASAFPRFLPKPVEIMSVPETPTNSSTPAGGTPRPELNLTEEHEPTPPRSRDEPTIDPIPMTGLEESKPVAATSEPMRKSPAPVHVEEPRPAEPKPEERRPLFGEPVPPKEPALHPISEPSAGETSDFTLNGGSKDVDKSHDKSHDKPKDRPEPPVTHTGPESKPVPAPAPAPIVETSRISPIDTPPSMPRAAEFKAAENSAPVEPAKEAPIKSSLPFEPVKAAAAPAVPAAQTAAAPIEPTKALPAQTTAPVEPVKPAPSSFEPVKAAPTQSTAPAEPVKAAPDLPSAPPEPLKPAAPFVGEKRKADDMAPSAEGESASTNLPAGDRPVPDAGSLAKKPKFDEASAQSNGNEAAVPNAAPAEAPPKAPKVTKPKKEKKPPVVGKTARKTRSQGPADV